MTVASSKNTFSGLIHVFGGSDVKNPPAVQKTQVQSLDWEDLMEKEVATHSSILAWKIPQIEEPGGLQFMGLQSSEPTNSFTFTLIIEMTFLLCVYAQLCPTLLQPHEL